MKDSLSGIVSMLETGSPEQRVAAAQVLAWLRPKAPHVVKALARGAQEGEAYLRPYAVDALGEIGNAASLASLIPVLHVEGALRDRVKRVFARAGKEAEGVLIQEFRKSDSETRLVVLDILAMSRGSEAMRLMITLIKDPKETLLAGHAFRALQGQIQGLAGEEVESRKAALRKVFQNSLRNLSRKVPVSARAFLLELLASVKAPSVRALFVNQSAPSHPPEVRMAALKGLKGMELTPAQTQKLINYLKEEDFLHVGGPTLEVLSDLAPRGAQMANALAKLLGSPRPEIRLFAIRSLGRYETATSARLLLPFLDSKDPKVQDLASQALGRNLEARTGVLKMFLGGRDLEEAHKAFPALLGLAGELTPPQLKRLIDRFMQLLDAEDPVKELYQKVLAAGDPGNVAPLLLGEARKLRQAGSYEKALRLLRTISGALGSRIGGDIRYEFAMVSLLSRKFEPEHKEGDPVIGHFCELLQAGYPLFEKVKKEKMLDSEAVFYLGRRFVERLNEERRFGSDLLNWLIKTEPEAKTSVQAMQKLKVEGLA